MSAAALLGQFEVEVFMKCRAAFRRVTCILLSVCVFGCGRADKPSPSARPRGTSAAARDAAGEAARAADDQVNEAECRQFAEHLQSVVVTPGDEPLGELTDWDHIFVIASEGVEIPKDQVAGARRGFRQGLAQSGDLFNQVAQIIAQGGRYDLLRVHRKDGKWRAMFRLLLPDGGVNYHDLEVHRNRAGEMKIADIYIFATGEHLSETLRRMFLQMSAELNRSFLERLSGKEQLMMKHLDDMQSITAALREGDPRRALKVYHRLPAELQREKTLLVFRVMAASTAQDEDELVAAVEMMREHHPEDACLDLMSIDYYLGRQDFDKALAAIDRLDAAVGTDPYLDVTRANVALLDNDFAQAQQLALGVIEEQPDLADAYWVMITVGLKEHDHAKTLEWLKRLDQTLPMEWFDLSAQADYAEFVKTPEYTAWLQYLAEREQP
jgi:hypothetical protein